MIWKKLMIKIKPKGLPARAFYDTDLDEGWTYILEIEGSVAMVTARGPVTEYGYPYYVMYAVQDWEYAEAYG